MNTYKRKLEDEDERGIVPDGQSIRVSMMAMDSTQRQIATIDERVQHNIEAGQATLEAAQHDSERAQAHADHFTAEREAQTDTSAYGAHCQRISEAWQQVPA
jgi:hypothetical protein